MKTSSKSPKKRAKFIKSVLIGLAAIAVALVIAVFVVRQVYHNNLKPVSGNQKVIIVNIPSGSTVSQIADILEKQEVIKSTWAFKQYVRSSDLQDSLKAGTYELKQSQSAQDIVGILSQGKITSSLVTIPPDRRIDQIRQTLIDSGFKAADVDNALRPSLYRKHPALVDLPSNATSLEGYLYPDSWQRNAATKPQDIIAQSLDEMQNHLTPELRSAFAAQGLDTHQAIILASIVEREVSNPNDKAQVAQVFLKRLHSKMLLGSDVTAYYGAFAAGVTPSLSYDSPYNTHVHLGLPAGPISNVTDSSLQAVAHPAKTDWLYFVSGDDGVTYFSKTLQQHEALVREHCKQLCAQN